MDHYDLLNRPDWTAESVLVVSPYVERGFFHRLAEQLQPGSMTVVIDDGCKEDDVVMVEDAVRTGSPRTTLKVVLGATRGIVHAKIFHIAWRTVKGYAANTFVCGSGNATRQAFDGDVNSELMCSVRLTRNHGPILEWIEHVHKAAQLAGRRRRQVEELRDAWISQGVYLRLPALTIKSARDKASNFDLWLQRGLLVPAYRPDPGFLRVHINLLKDIPPGELGRQIMGRGFVMPRRRRLSVHYLEGAHLPPVEDERDAASSDEPEGEHTEQTEQWRARYCVWTQLGDWCSEACHRDMGHLFRRSGYEEREENLDLLTAFAHGGARAESRERFLEAIRSLWGKRCGGDGAGFELTMGTGADPGIMLPG